MTKIEVVGTRNNKTFKLFWLNQEKDLSIYYGMVVKILKNFKFSRHPSGRLHTKIDEDEIELFRCERQPFTNFKGHEYLTTFAIPLNENDPCSVDFEKTDADYIISFNVPVGKSAPNIIPLLIEPGRFDLIKELNSKHSQIFILTKTYPWLAICLKDL
jgi:hypothetical protein